MYRSFAAIVAMGMLAFGVADYVHSRYTGYSQVTKKQKEAELAPKVVQIEIPEIY